MSGIASAEFNTQELIELLTTSPLALINFLIPEELVYAVPDFHIEMLSAMTDEEITHLAIAIPRGHAKTTLLKIAAFKLLMFTHRRFGLYVSDTFTLAANACLDIVRLLQRPQVEQVFGKIEFLTIQESKGYYQFVLPALRHKPQKLCMLKAVGRGGQVRGMNIDNQRPEFLLADDIENSETIKSEMGYQNIKQWWYGPLEPAIDKTAPKIIHIGNLTTSISLLADQLKSSKWYSIRYGAVLSNGKPLWEDKFSLAFLNTMMQDYKTQGMLHIFMAEMMNQPMAGNVQLISADDFITYPQLFPDQLKHVFITIDPAHSSETWAHKSAITVHGFCDDATDDGIGYWQIVDYVAEIGLDPFQLFQKVVDLCRKWNVGVVGIETVAYQAVLKPLFDQFKLHYGMEYLEFVGILSRRAKTERIYAWVALIKNKTYRLANNQAPIITQLLAYNPMSKHNDDDIIDAGSMGVIMLDRYSHIIYRETRNHKTQEIITYERLPV